MRATEFLQEQLLDEVAMNPSRLRQMAAQTGAIAGIEFEMLVPDAKTDDDEGESEPDFDTDERVSSFDEIEDFFSGGEGFNSRRDIQRLIEEVQQEYYEWFSEQWYEDGRDFFNEYAEDHFDEESALETAGEEIHEANPELPTDSDEFRELVSNRVEELKEEWLEEEWDDQGRIFDRAREEWEQDNGDVGDFFRSNGYRYMSDLPWNNHVVWPYITYTSTGDTDISEIASEFQDAIGRPVDYSESYHGAKRKENTYVVEPDSSLKPPEGFGGLEFVSPPLPLDEMLSDFQKVIEWAKGYGCETNESTGLHMNVSVPNFSSENLDYVKLALLLGDRYVLEQFGRTANTYCKSAMADITEKVRTRPDIAQNLLQQLNSGIQQSASKVIHNGITGKYVSINTHNGYIEFRSPGGDWLDSDWNKLESTLLRFVVALDAACDPNKYRQDYLKKLYALLQPKTDNDPIAVFAKFSAGALSKQELTNWVRSAQLQRQVSKNTEPGKKYWWNVQWDNNRRIEVVATNKQEAIRAAAQEWSVPESRLAGATVTLIRPVEGEEQSKQQEPLGQWGRWEIVSSYGDTLGFVSGRNETTARQAAIEWLSQRYRDVNPNQMRFSVRPAQ